MERRIPRGVLWILMFILAVGNASASAQTSPAFSVDAEAGILLDFDSGQILFAQDGAKSHIPASLVKVMTIFVAMDQLADGKVSLTDTITVSEKAWRMGGSQMFLEVGEQVTIEQLLYGVAVLSGNDACVALAEGLAGTEELYVRWMNDKAASLGLDMHFVDVHGLSDQNRITAESMAKLARAYISRYPQVLQYHRERSYSYQPRSQDQPIHQNNRNGLLWRYEGTDGLKTGFLSKAGYNLVATAKQDSRRLIAVVLGAKGEREREDEAVKLLNYGFRNFELIDVGQVADIGPQRVYRGRERSVTLRPENGLVTIPRGTRQDLEVAVAIERIVAPVEEGQRVGRLQVRHGGELIKETDLVATAAVPRGNFLRVIWDSILMFFASIFQR